MKRFFLVFFLYLFLFVSSTYAVTATITQHPSSITTTDPFTITVVIEGASEGQNYLRIDLYKDGTKNYFGETCTNPPCTDNSWYGASSDGTLYYPITIESGIFTGDVIGRVGTPSTTDYEGEGKYRLRVRRYTSANNYEISTNTVEISIIASSTPTETPTPPPAGGSTPSPTPSPTPPLSITPTPQPSFDHVLISEAMVYPDGEDEWVKLYNDNDFSVSLVNWYLDDGENTGSSPKQFSLEIAAKGYANVTIASAMFNNDGDMIRLLDHTQKEKDRIIYETAEKGKTVNKETNTNAASPTATPTATPTQKPTATPTAIPSPTIFPSTTPSISPTALNLFEETPSSREGTVLSVKTKNTKSEKKKQELARTILYVKGFSATSFSFSFCTMLYVLYKIKKKLQSEVYK